MEYVNEPAERVEAELTARGVTVPREPYNPRSRSLFSDFVGFLRTPEPGQQGDAVRGREGPVRYYTVAQRGPRGRRAPDARWPTSRRRRRSCRPGGSSRSRSGSTRSKRSSEGSRRTSSR